MEETMPTASGTLGLTLAKPVVPQSSPKGGCPSHTHRAPDLPRARGGCCSPHHPTDAEVWELGKGTSTPSPVPLGPAAVFLLFSRRSSRRNGGDGQRCRQHQPIAQTLACNALTQTAPNLLQKAQSEVAEESGASCIYF